MKKTGKGRKRRTFLWITILVLIISYTSYKTYDYWKEISDNYKTKKELEDKYNKLLEEKEVLETDVKKLQDPEYVAKYAREKYLYSKDGELIIKIIDEDE